MVQTKDSVEDFLDQELEDLLSMEITSVSRKKQHLCQTTVGILK